MDSSIGASGPNLSRSGTGEPSAPVVAISPVAGSDDPIYRFRRIHRSTLPLGVLMSFRSVGPRGAAIVALLVAMALSAPRLARAGGYRSCNAVTGDGVGGVIIAWEDSRS